MRNKTYTVLFCLYLFICAIGIIVCRNKKFSDMENRELAKFPEVNQNSIFDGTFGVKFDKYVTDHMAGKDDLVKLKVLTDRLMNKTLINDVYFAADDYLIADYKNPYKQLSNNIKYINEFADNNDFDLTWLIIPNACYVYADKLPIKAYCYDQNEVLAYIYGNVSEKVNIVDCFNELKQSKDEYIFYRTDHHWTMNGAYIGYKVLCENMGIEALEKNKYNVEIANDSFLGSQYSKAPTFNQKTDDILFYNNPVGEYKLALDDKNTEVYDSLYVRDNLAKKDKYTAYLGGNFPYMKITSNSNNEEKILVVKDSFAHSLLPFLADNYNEIYVVDLRYYHKSVSELAKNNGISKIVFINNLDFISTDNNFLWLE